ncbi:dephospho-CoA kinase [Alkaliphilus metalliredigens QYMF]|uniref:Dephospho-CoA kinase n=2 Tax=Alkaliphilus TaxID=114627 RepID=A6TSU5_ALKMQ|nr:dephospho-CoA kinase [Alkaliphilus metalliredigens QYMF]
MSMKKIIGLTGGIATGKSTVSQILKNLGAIIIDADTVARQVAEKGEPVLQEIQRVFGTEMILKDGTLDRKKLGALVFNNHQAMQQLNEMIHPKIIEEIKKALNWYKNNRKNYVIIIDAALLIELRLTEMVDEVWVVAVSKEIQKKRLMKRNDLTEGAAINRIEMQMSIEEKMTHADQVIDNSGNQDDLKKQVKVLWDQMK